MSAPVVKGWCPTAYAPMKSGDGLLVRINPRLGWLSAAQMFALCDMAETHGNGMIDLTSRANLQVRGVSEERYPALLAGLIAQGLVDDEPDCEARRTLVIGSNLISESAVRPLAEAIETGIERLPILPPKMGVAINLGRILAVDVPGDFRFESSLEGLILRADGAHLGRRVSVANAVDALVEMMDWFLETGGAESKQMRAHLESHALPDAWQVVAPKHSESNAMPGAVLGGRNVGLPFGASDADALRRLVRDTCATHVGTTPWRLLRLAGANEVDVPGFSFATDPVLDVSACPGAPACAQASVETRELARRLVADKISGTLHVSGCSKGCASRNAAEVTLVGRGGRFDLVRNGRAGDMPVLTDLSEADVLDAL